MVTVLPRNSPTPIAPPIAIMAIWRGTSFRLSPSSVARGADSPARVRAPFTKGVVIDTRNASVPREAVDTPGAAAWRRVRAVLVRVRRVPRRERTGGVLIRPEAVGVADLSHRGRGIRRPVA